MFDEIPATAKPRRPRRAVRLICSVAAFSAMAFGYGSAVAPTLTGPASITATPEDPCLMDNTCGLENQIPGVQGQGEDLLVQCEEQHLRGVFAPECEQIN